MSNCSPKLPESSNSPIYQAQSIYKLLLCSKSLFTYIPEEIVNLNDKYKFITTIDFEQILSYKILHKNLSKKTIFQIFEEQEHKMDRSITENLNKVTITNSTEVLNIIYKIPQIFTESGIASLINIILYKAQREPKYIELYAFICKELSFLEYDISTCKKGKVINFLTEKIDCSLTELLKTYDENKVRSCNFVMFVGYMYDRSIFNDNFMDQLVKKIKLQNNYELLYNLIHTNCLNSRHLLYVNTCNYLIEALINEKSLKISMRIKFKIIDSIDILLLNLLKQKNYDLINKLKENNKFIELLKLFKITIDYINSVIKDHENSHKHRVHILEHTHPHDYDIDTSVITLTTSPLLTAPTAISSSSISQIKSRSCPDINSVLNEHVNPDSDTEENISVSKSTTLNVILTESEINFIKELLKIVQQK